MSDFKVTVKWGIIGCGDVCEVKSGPAFQKLANSSLIAVMRRDKALAADYAKRHGVPKYYTNAQDLINDPEVNAIYIATPPATHETYAIDAINAGKPVYIEKPLSITSESTERILRQAHEKGVKATGAYYRRGLPLFRKVKELIHGGAIGKVSLISIRLLLPPAHNSIVQTSDNWRVNPAISGGGLFHDLAPHMLDIMYWIFGEPVNHSGYSLNQHKAYDAPDFTIVNAEFEKGIALNGIWAFNVPSDAREDNCQIIGDKGTLKFSFFPNNPLKINSEGSQQNLSFINPENIQYNHIEDVVKFFRGEGPNPCRIEEALISMKMIDDAS
ncbi:Gfo/Idh/MocA family protein [Marinoscillum sp. MHG1-6]|uniref:Gfo/Idh/MocA family protein n=1 Tax=Marinoscillum sp. MHG1-6 TaxID=2959627 RepID=UPI0021586575|nr:Gfo/Idh/MocA family oxidoreductase [Marinoscillum sp. MHG1-6]